MIVIYYARVILTRKLPILRLQGVGYGHKMFLWQIGKQILGAYLINICVVHCDENASNKFITYDQCIATNVLILKYAEINVKHGCYYHRVHIDIQRIAFWLKDLRRFFSFRTVKIITSKFVDTIQVDFFCRQMALSRFTLSRKILK